MEINTQECLFGQHLVHRRCIIHIYIYIRMHMNTPIGTKFTHPRIDLKQEVVISCQEDEQFSTSYFKSILGLVTANDLIVWLIKCSLSTSKWC